MVGSFMTIVCNNVNVILNKQRDPNYYRNGRRDKELAFLFVYHIINYVIFYFALTNFIGHMAARY